MIELSTPAFLLLEDFNENITKLNASVFTSIFDTLNSESHRKQLVVS